MRKLFDKALGAYLGLAIGDALGATVEFMRPREIALQYGIHREIIGGGWLKLARGQVTDDTTMSLALGAALLQGGAPALRGHAGNDDIDLLTNGRRRLDGAVSGHTLSIHDRGSVDLARDHGCDRRRGRR